jgi:hypothetical protein
MSVRTNLTVKIQVCQRFLRDLELPKVLVQNLVFITPCMAPNSALLNEACFCGGLVEPNPFMARLLLEARPKDAVLNTRVATLANQSFTCFQTRHP